MRLRFKHQKFRADVAKAGAGVRLAPNHKVCYNELDKKELAKNVLEVETS